MQRHVLDVMRHCTTASDECRINFGEVVKLLMEAGIERYHADLCRSEKTYYLPDGSSEMLSTKALQTKPVQNFVATGVDAAVRSIQAGKIDYQEFCRRVLAAGCIGYHVFIAGRQVIYYGRNGEQHVEPFPGAK
jgi:uncharacterized protein YbcV (DUF1398 family)